MQRLGQILVRLLFRIAAQTLYISLSDQYSPTFFYYYRLDVPT